MKSKKGHNSKSKSRANKPDPNLSLGTVVNPRNEARFFRNEGGGKPAHLRRRLTQIQAFTAATGNNFAIAFASGTVTGATEWTALSANYQQYRVRALKVILVPRNSYNNGFAATVWFPGTILSGRYPSGSSAATVAALWAQSGAKLHPEWEVLSNMATMDDNPDSSLFTDCNLGAPPALSQYGVQFLGNLAAPAIYNGVITHDAYVEYDVEFIARN